MRVLGWVLIILSALSLLGAVVSGLYVAATGDQFLADPGTFYYILIVFGVLSGFFGAMLVAEDY